jgi:hypothetical protein
MATDYNKLVLDGLAEMDLIYDEHERLENELVRLEQFILAAANFVDSGLQNIIKARFQTMRERESIRKVGLGEAIKLVLRNASDPISVSEIRDRLSRGGFDFSGYKSNPLASISTTVTRLYESKTANVHKFETKGVATYLIFPTAKRKQTAKEVIEKFSAQKALEGPSKKG